MLGDLLRAVKTGEETRLVTSPRLGEAWPGLLDPVLWGEAGRLVVTSLYRVAGEAGDRVSWSLVTPESGEVVFLWVYPWARLVPVRELWAGWPYIGITGNLLGLWGAVARGPTDLLDITGDAGVGEGVTGAGTEVFRVARGEVSLDVGWPYLVRGTGTRTFDGWRTIWNEKNDVKLKWTKKDCNWGCLHFVIRPEIRAASLSKVGAGAGAECWQVCNMFWNIWAASGAQSNLIILQSLVKYCRPKLHVAGDKYKYFGHFLFIPRHFS